MSCSDPPPPGNHRHRQASVFLHRFEEAAGASQRHYTPSEESNSNEDVALSTNDISAPQLNQQIHHSNLLDKNKDLNKGSFPRAYINRRKKEIVDRLMAVLTQCLDTILGPDMKACDRQRSYSVGSKALMTSSRSGIGQTSRGLAGQKRQLQEDERDGSQSGREENGQRNRNIKRAKTQDGISMFACPYYKRDPQKFKNCRSCCGPGWSSVHRVKYALSSPWLMQLLGLTVFYSESTCIVDTAWRKSCALDVARSSQIRRVLMNTRGQKGPVNFSALIHSRLIRLMALTRRKKRNCVRARRCLVRKLTSGTRYTVSYSPWI
jgi:hypothetical protein